MSEEGSFTKKDALATNEQKKQVVQLSKTLGVDYTDVLKQVGFTEGSPFTQEQYRQAIMILKGISDKKE